MWGFRAFMPVALAICMATITETHAALPRNEVSFHFKGFSGNTGGIPVLAGKYRYEFFEVTAGLMAGQISAIIAARKALNEDGVLVPHVSAGVQILSYFSLLVGTGLEVLMPPMDILVRGSRLGLRFDTDVLVPIYYGGVSLSPRLSMGIAWHF